MNNIYIKSIYIKELRHLKDISINIDDNEKKNLIITGRNGSGKTILLEAVKSYLKFFENPNYLPHRKDESNKIELWFEKFENTFRDIMDNPNLSLKFDYKNYNFTINEEAPELYAEFTNLELQRKLM